MMPGRPMNRKVRISTGSLAYLILEGAGAVRNSRWSRTTCKWKIVDKRQLLMKAKLSSVESVRADRIRGFPTSASASLRASQPTILDGSRDVPASEDAASVAGRMSARSILRIFAYTEVIKGFPR
jgi:hypothetical protein